MNESQITEQVSSSHSQ